MTKDLSMLHSGLIITFMLFIFADILSDSIVVGKFSASLQSAFVL